MAEKINIDDKVVIAHIKAVRDFAANELNAFGNSAAAELDDLVASLGTEDVTKKKEFQAQSEETRKVKDSIVRELQIYTDSLFAYLSEHVSVDSMAMYKKALGNLEASKAKKGTKWTKPGKK